MQVSLTTTKGLERRLEVAVPGERVAGEVDQRLKKLARTARIKGFRPGKVPYAIVKQQFGSQVHAEAVSDLMQSTFAEAVSQQKLRPAGGPRIEPIAVGPGGELRYAAVFEVLPEISVKPLGGVEVQRAAATVTEDDVAAMIESMRAQRPIFTVVERAAQEGDRVTLDYEGRIDGVVFTGGSAEAVHVVIGAHRILPEIEQALTGMAAGASKTVDAKFPDNYGAQAVAGKQAQFDLKVREVEQQSLPPLDEAFVRTLGLASGAVAELHDTVRKSMEREVAEAARTQLREQLFEALLRDNPLEVPQSMVEEQIREMQAQLLRRKGKQDGVPPAPEALAASARQRVVLGLLIGEIVRSQELKLDRARIEQRLEALIASYPDPQEARRQYLGSREAMEHLESAALEDQALDWMLSQVKVIEKPSSFRELTGFGQQG